MDKKTSNREWRDVMRGAKDEVPTSRAIHAFAQRVEALAIAGCDKRHAAELTRAIAAEREMIAAHLSALGLDDAAQDVSLRNWNNLSSADRQSDNTATHNNRG